MGNKSEKDSDSEDDNFEQVIPAKRDADQLDYAQVEVSTLPPSLLDYIDPRRIARECSEERRDDVVKVVDLETYENASNERWLITGGVYSRELSGGSDYSRKLEYMLTKYFAAEPLLKSQSIKRAWAVMNMRLASAFCSQRTLMSERIKYHPEIYLNQSWTNLDRRDQRKFTYDSFMTMVNKFPWNMEDNNNVPIIPVIHGTSAAVAWAIVRTGFTSLSALDAGYYGSGMYFTSNAMYALPYYGNKSRPALLLCFMIPGNVFPVVEARTETNSLMGQPIRNGYQSHYVMTSPNGAPITTKTPITIAGGQFDEIVCDQENQILPVFLVEFDKDKMGDISMQFQRDALTRDKETQLEKDLALGDMDLLEPTLKAATNIKQTPMTTTYTGTV